MSKQFKLILFFGFFLISQSAFACSCERNYFCDYIKYEEYDYKMVAVRAKITDKIVYEDDTNAIYLEVIESYRDDVGAGNYIKLHGDWQEADCHVNMNRFSPFTEHIFVIGVSTEQYGNLGFPFNSPIPDNGNYWEFSPLLCDFLSLSINDGVVKGWITDEIFEYPWELFNGSLEDCSFNLTTLNEAKCADEDYAIYPNPSFDGNIIIKNNYRRIPVSQVRVLDYNGQLVLDKFYTPEDNAIIKLNIAQKGLFFVEIICGENKYVRRILVV